MEIMERYVSRGQEFRDQSDQLKEKYNRFAWIRLFSFLIGVGFSGYAFTIQPIVGIVMSLVFLIFFGRFIIWHQKLQRNQRHRFQLALVNDDEVQLLNRQPQNMDDGQVFVDAQHPYSIDLDLFGPFSIFQYFNRANTSIGKSTLADYLNKPADTAEIYSRQDAHKELSSLLDWRQHFQAWGRLLDDDPDHIRQLDHWLKLPSFIQNNAVYRLARWLNPPLALGAIFLMLFYIPWQIGILFFLIPGYILYKTKKQIDETHDLTGKAGEMLSSYSRLIKLIEEEKFESKKLQNLQLAFRPIKGKDGRKFSSKELKRLAYIISQLNVRYNPFAFLFNMVGLWDLHWVLALERWRDRNKNQISSWFDSLKEFEALLSGATFAYNHSEFVYPEIIERGDVIFDAKGLAHPLISQKERIGNDLSFSAVGHIKLLTGSNMSGKSTFLRSVGLGIILARAGWPVCAKSLKLFPLDLFSSMRTQDALHESTSSFYAELKRLKLIIDSVETKSHVFFLLDEILKGTNSGDRHTGSRALIKQLIEHKGSGIIATHDLELADLEEKHPNNLENVSFEVKVNDDELFFDYTLRKGVSKSFNATQLMRRMGIRIDPSMDH